MPDVEAVVKRFDSLAGDRGTWEQHWEEIAERVLPRQIGFVGARTPGEKRTQKVFDSRPAIVLRR